MELLNFENRALITDLYQLTMLASYFQHNHNPIATFEMFIRHLPENRGYLIFAGLEQALDYLENLKFLPEEIEYLKSLPVFKHIPKEFFDFLKEFRFKGEVWALEEGEVFFAEEPILQVRAPLIQAQLVETYLLSIINFQSLIATKASRVVDSARGRQVVDFGTRRAHGPEASVLAARACYIGGCVGTSNVYCAYKLEIPPVGTMAHSYVMSFPTELEAFKKFQASFPEHTILLIDTYDTIRSAHQVAKMKEKINGVRLDSGDLLQLSRAVRKILDQAGKKSVRILASGDLNEYLIDELVRKKAPIDSFGVGTEMVTSRDAPALGGIYKLVEIETPQGTKYTLKLSSQKATYPARKQVFRFKDENGTYAYDLIAGAREKHPAKPLLKKVMEKGKRLQPSPPIDEIQKKVRRELEKFPPRIRRIFNPGKYPVKYSSELKKLRQKVVRKIRREQGLF